jgi:EAL domain-containing protein (putative c-di-GMP-specific phosphodiesterase class I)
MMDPKGEASDEETLLTEMERIKRSDDLPFRYGAIISMNSPAWFSRRRENFLQIIKALQTLLAGGADAGVYAMHNYNIVLLFRRDHRYHLDSIEDDLKGILRSHASAAGLEEGQTAQAYELFPFKDTFADFEGIIGKIYEDYKTFQERRQRLLQKAGTTMGAAQGQPLTVSSLSKLEDLLRKADITGFLKSQIACAMAPGEPIRPFFREVFVGVNDLRQLVAPKNDLRAVKPLFQQLTRTMDQRVLRAMFDGFVTRQSGNVSLNLNVQTIMSTTFREFDTRIANFIPKSQLIVEMQRFDIFWDFAEYLTACEFLRNAGYRVLLDGVTLDVLPLFARPEMGADFIKVFYRPERPAEWREANVAQKVAAAEPGRLIMARCETAEALELGQAAGIRIFKGFHIDALMRDPNRKIA